MARALYIFICSQRQTTALGDLHGNGMEMGTEEGQGGDDEEVVSS